MYIEYSGQDQNQTCCNCNILRMQITFISELLTWKQWHFIENTWAQLSNLTQSLTSRFNLQTDSLKWTESIALAWQSPFSHGTEIWFLIQLFLIFLSHWPMFVLWPANLVDYSFFVYQNIPCYGPKITNVLTCIFLISFTIISERN